MKLITSLLIISQILIISIYAQQPWFQLTSGQNSSLREIQFTDSLNGFHCYDWSNGFVGFGGLNKSPNGGNSWIFAFTGIPFKCIHFINGSTGWFAGGYWDDGLRTSREIYKTTNGGLNFTRQFIDSLFGSFTDIHFVNADYGYCITNNGRIFRTTNSGSNWAILDILASDLRGIHFTNNTTGYIISLNGYLYKTTNSGGNWSSTFLTNSLTDIFFINETTGWICGASNTLYKTTDGWASRESIPFNYSGISSIHFRSE